MTGNPVLVTHSIHPFVDVVFDTLLQITGSDDSARADQSRATHWQDNTDTVGKVCMHNIFPGLRSAVPGYLPSRRFISCSSGPWTALQPATVPPSRCPPAKTNKSRTVHDVSVQAHAIAVFDHPER